MFLMNVLENGKVNRMDYKFLHEMGHVLDWNIRSMEMMAIAFLRLLNFRRRAPIWADFNGLQRTTFW